MELQRREFLKRTAAIVTIASPMVATGGKILGAGDRLRIACIGSGGRGTGMTGVASRHGEVVAYCDADLRRAEEAKKRHKNEKAEIAQDYRTVLDRKDIDVIVQGCPDHWHTKVNVESLRAGKAVYGEKPLTLTIEEGKLLRKVVKETKGIFQTGTQQRSGPTFQTAIELIRAGRLGKIKTVYVSLPHYGPIGGPFPAEEVPKELDWDLAQGQAPAAPYSQKRARNWRQWYEYAGGNVTDWGNHHTDMLLWGLDAENTGPLTVQAQGIFTNVGKPDCFNVPYKFCSRMIFADGVEALFFEGLGKHWKALQEGKESPTSKEDFDFLFGKDCPEEVKATERDGLMFIGDKGRLFVNRGGVYGKPFDELKENPLPDGAPETAWRAPNRGEMTGRYDDGVGGHMKNFFDCVRSREQPVATAELEHRAVTLCHLTNISLRLGGRKIQWDPVKEEIVDDKEAQAMQQREQRKPYVIS